MTCPLCAEPDDRCRCPDLAPIDTRLEVVILQHPQERREALGTGVLAARRLARARIAVGLSWPNLAAALGRPAAPWRWATLYLGAAREFPAAPDGTVNVLDRRGRPLEASARRTALAALEGLILLDGTWSQAKTLWWRNPWLLKTHRVILNPPARALYTAIRREPRRPAVSTLEAAAIALAEVEGAPTLIEQLTAPLAALVARVGADQAPPRGVSGATAPSRRPGSADRTPDTSPE